MSNIVFMGTPQFAVPILKKINQKYKINCVFTQPPNKSNRRLKIYKSPVHIFAETQNIPLRCPVNNIDDKKYKKMIDHFHIISNGFHIFVSLLRKMEK